MNTTIRKIGNSEGVILPKELLDRLNMKAGDQLQIVETDKGIVLEPVDDSFERQMEAARKVMDKYKVALQKLAE
ncbi:MAG: AbrB/MazE/SpoVT family DNA-binding domain-containing protein [Mesorhizobium sp.]|uniref:AbrB/MazE/SpoVT family DNA-binding domain-containing protein n=1 Tax=unclassified Mesorhizobium TaxID=325217 RepID=UPI000F757112|nr:MULTISPECIES: AbrB/MazE/SpoVT family DNA-binding domain-containing protein [unclassified Mesorhizobium]RVD73630.1 AbrB/MazE/SpoVT family DNA-binding domain-containing protein [Mesorhizobium sp. M4A.F.Ca.ET.029.04.2.1]AZO48334.1 AbrB/MazE/SpoVT family DNA-binding domain-containing protein [Mesorhizobium sp. M4B.F.Ca.ET.058.02.1.1]RUX43168.1 AbrB/MazE/SpoVT family DNA-binding domain-containing protein [Mesorhizobium sp. M4A.F.Ca.ET.050.02.1.1]RVC45594.1 AbrB/MazE/SpoVT family DNA-binding domai